jgi:hypothetical protein
LNDFQARRGINNHRDVKGGITLYIQPTLLPKFTDEAPIKFDFAICDSLNLVASTYFLAVKCGTVLVHVMVVAVPYLWNQSRKDRLPMSVGQGAKRLVLNQ